MKHTTKPNHVRLLISLLFLFVGFSASAQTSIKGFVRDGKSKEALDFASVFLQGTTDSTFASFVFSDEDGSFTFDKIEPGSYSISVVFAGYNAYKQPVEVSNGSDVVNLEILMAGSNVRLSTAFIDARSIPVAIKGDTLIYNPNAFKTKNNAVVEDLLKKLPGVQVDRDGNITAQGEKVTKVLVNGKEFFGNDPTKATRNLDAMTLEKIEVLDKKSDDAEFTGVDDGNREKVLNLVLKKGAKKGFFGKVEAGAGTEDTYLGKFTINRFKEDNQYTVIGNINNLNRNGFNWQEYYGMLNGASGVNFGDRTYWFSQNQWMGSNQAGLQTNAVLGTNANIKLSKKAELNFSYFGMGRENDREASTTTENYLPTTTIYGNSEQDETSANGQHKGVFRLTWKPDTLNWIDWSGEVDFSNGTTDLFSTTSSSNDSEAFINKSIAKTYNSKFNRNQKTQVTWRKKAKSNNNSFVLQGGFEYNMAGDSSLWVNKLASSDFVFDRTTPFELSDAIAATGLISYGRVTYNFELDSQRHITLYADNKMTLGDFEMTRFGLGNDSTYLGQSPSIGGDYRVSKFSIRFSKNSRDRKRNGWYRNFSLGAINIMVNRSLAVAGEQNFDQMYWIPYVRGYFSYNKQNKMRFGSWFNTTENFPGQNQVNPVANIQNPLRQTIGDISLDPYVNYNWGMNLHKQDRIKNRYWGFGANASFVPNNVIQIEDFSNTNIRVTSYDNEKYMLSTNVNTNYTFMVKKWNLKAQTSIRGSRFESFRVLNDDEVQNINYSVGAGIELAFDFKKVDIELAYEPSYSLQTTNFTAGNPSFLNQSVSGEVVYEITKRIEISTEYDMYFFNAQAIGQRQFVPLLNAQLSVDIDTAQKWNISLVGFDMLNQNQNIDRNFFGTSYSETRQNTLTRYFMFRLTYSIRKGSKKEPQHRRRH